MPSRSLLVYVALSCLCLLASCTGAMNWLAYRHDPQGPQTAGAVDLPGLSAPVEVIRDKWAIPHIFAQTETDLLRAMGYVHAQDRLFSMDFFRRLATGRLAEVVGDRPLETTLVFGAKTTVEQDMGMRVLGLEHLADRYLELVDPEMRALLEAYAQGVNDYIQTHGDKLPIEFNLIGYEPAPWRPQDSIALSRLLGWLLATNAQLELLRGVADDLLGVELSEQLLPVYHYPGAPRIIADYRFPLARPSLDFDPTPITPLTGKELSQVTLLALLGEVDSEPIDASNNWVVAGSRAVNGKPIVCNDPHLPHLAPSIFHLTHLSGAGYDVVGATFPGVPFVVLGHNRHIGWAATNNQGDTQDLYAHQVDPHDPGRYRTPDGWENFVLREETIAVKEGPLQRTEKITVRVSRFGPVISDRIDPTRQGGIISLRWSGMDFMGHPDAFWELERAADSADRRVVAARYWADQRGSDLHAFRRINLGRDCREFFQGLSILGTPRQNWICGDTSGNIAYAAAGLIPVRNRGDGRRIARAYADEGRWIGFVPFAEIPQQVNPDQGYFATANNLTTDLEAYPYPWAYSYVTGHRAKRIAQLLTEKEKVSAATMNRIQGDQTSLLADDFLPLFGDAALGDESLADAIRILQEWNGVSEANSAGAALFHTAMDELVRLMLSDELGPDLFHAYAFSHTTSGMPLTIALDKESPFHDNLGTPQIETWQDSYNLALLAAYQKLQQDLGPDPRQWRWGAIHTLTLQHTLGGEKALAEAVNLGPLPMGGASDTIWASFIHYGQGRFTAQVGPAFRHIVDLRYPERSWMTLDTGNWGQPLTEHYADLHELWKRNELAPVFLNRTDIERHVLGVLILEPVTHKE